ncbi:MAG: hypothetical protein PHC70_04840 [Patescibacteria group bacterium]|nr:hypothetical protein [Patescibacteria group bacterium]
MKGSAPPLFARILLGISALLTVGVVYWFLSGYLEALPTPTVPPLRRAQGFNPKADITKQPIFQILSDKYIVTAPDMPLGRENPFLPYKSGELEVPPEGLPIPGTKLKIIMAPAVTSTESAPTGTTML